MPDQQTQYGSDEKERGSLISPGDEKEIVSYADSRLTNYKSILNQKQYRPQWLVNYKMWRSYIDPSKYPHRSKIFLPVTFQYVETVLPRIAANKVYLHVAARQPTALQFVEQLNAFSDWAVQRNRFQEKWGTFCKQLLIHGFSPMYVYWNYDPNSGFPYPDVAPIDLFNFYCDPQMFSNLAECPEVIIRAVTTQHCLETKAEMELYDQAKVAQVRGTQIPMDDYDLPIGYRLSAVGKGGSASALDGSDTSGNWNKVEILILCTNKEIITIANRKVVLKRKPNVLGMIPVVGTSWMEDLFHMFGLGQVEVGQYLQHALNASSNMLFDARTLTLNPTTLVGAANSTVSNTEFQAGAGKIVRVNTVNEVREYVKPDMGRGMDEERSWYLTMMKEVTSALDVMRGASGADETATQAQINNAAVETKLTLPMQRLEGVLSNIGLMWQGLAQAYMSPETIKALGMNDQMFPTNMNPKAFQAKVDFVPVIEPQAPLTKVFQRRQAQEALGFLLKTPGFPDLMMSSPNLASTVYGLILRNYDIDKHGEVANALVGAFQEKQQQMMAAQQAQTQAPAQGQPTPEPQKENIVDKLNMDPEFMKSILNEMTDEEIAQFTQLPTQAQAAILGQLQKKLSENQPANQPGNMQSLIAKE